MWNIDFNFAPLIGAFAVYQITHNLWWAVVAGCVLGELGRRAN
jgi:hypothetical protein